MLKGYIIESYNNMGTVYVSTRLIEEAQIRNVQLSIIGVHDVDVRDGVIYHVGRKLEQSDFVINRYKWGKIKNEINLLGKKSYNSLNSFEIYVNKYEQMKRLTSEYFLKPKYLLGNSCLHYDMLSHCLGERIVAKGLENSMGREIFLLESETDMEYLKRYGEHKEWLFEEFIETSYGEDLRIYAIRGEVVGCMKRKAETDFRANLALGANIFSYPVTDKIKNIAGDIYLQTGLDFVGIDLLFGEKCFYLCEINVMPGIQGMEKATGVNVAGMMIDRICKDFNYE